MSPPTPDPPNAVDHPPRGADGVTRRIVEFATRPSSTAAGAWVCLGVFVVSAAVTALSWNAAPPLADGVPSLAEILLPVVALPGILAVELALVTRSNRRARGGEVAVVRCPACDYVVAAWRHRLGATLNTRFGFAKMAEFLEQVWPLFMGFVKWYGALMLVAAPVLLGVAIFGDLPQRTPVPLLAVLAVVMAAFAGLLVLMSRWRPNWPPPEVNAGRACPLCWEPLPAEALDATGLAVPGGTRGA